MARVRQMINQHDVVSVEVKKAENNRRDDGTVYQTLDIEIVCRDKESRFALTLSLFSEGETITVNQ